MSARTLLRLGAWSLEFKPQDAWIGAHWQREQEQTWHRPGIDNPAMPCFCTIFDLWICIVPMLPLHFRRVTR